MKQWLVLLFFYVSSLSFGAEFKDDVTIISKDGTRLSANLFYHPEDKTLRPGIIFINSWILEEHEYILIAKKFADEGYNVLSYSARGWGASQGEVNVASPQDIDDVSSAVDFLIANSSTDPNKIGASGVSYGGGISFLASAKEPRIKAIAALSGWVNLVDSLYPGQTANQLWSNILLYTGMIAGRLSKSVKNYVSQLNNYENIDEIRSWAGLRSADNFISETNKNQTAVLIINSWNDTLFNPNSIIEYFKNLRTPKKLVLQEGIHGISELGSLVGLHYNNSWGYVKDWFDRYLKGQNLSQNSVSESTQNKDSLVEMQIKGTSNFETISSEDSMRTLSTDSFYLVPPSDKKEKYGTLDSRPYNEIEVNRFATNKDSEASTGIPVFGAFFDAYLSVSVFMLWPKLSPENSFSFKTAPMVDEYIMRGVSNLAISVASSGVDQTLVAYLYDINRFGVSKLITHGVKTFSAPPGTEQNIQINFFATAYNIPKGHQLGLVIDSRDAIYKEKHKNNQQVKLIYTSEHLNSLTIKQNLL